jgi:4-hydroxybenzoate polyprenyltransferase
MNTSLASPYSAKAISLALIVIVVCPSFFFQRFGKRLCSAMTYFNGAIIGLAAVSQDPLILTINPILAIVGITINSRKKAKMYE